VRWPRPGQLPKRLSCTLRLRGGEEVAESQAGILDAIRLVMSLPAALFAQIPSSPSSALFT